MNAEFSARDRKRFGGGPQICEGVWLYPEDAKRPLEEIQWGGDLTRWPVFSGDRRDKEVVLPAGCQAQDYCKLTGVTQFPFVR